MINVHVSLGPQVQSAVGLLQKIVKEDAFWVTFRQHCSQHNISQHDFLEDDEDIINHIKFMWSCRLYVNVMPYRTRNPWSSVIGYADGNTVFENMRKINDLTLAERTGHIGHEITHLFGYRHDYQGQRTSPAVLFGEAAQAYAEDYIKRMNIAVYQPELH